jgi:hypothetical protein
VRSGREQGSAEGAAPVNVVSHARGRSHKRRVFCMAVGFSLEGTLARDQLA